MLGKKKLALAAPMVGLAAVALGTIPGALLIDSTTADQLNRGIRGISGIRS
jgi:hypothetical protein